MSILYKWNDHVDQSLPHVELVEDLDPYGTCRLLCPCGKEFGFPSVLNKRGGMDFPVTSCPHCEGNIVFPRADW